MATIVRCRRCDLLLVKGIPIYPGRDRWIAVNRLGCEDGPHGEHDPVAYVHAGEDTPQSHPLETDRDGRRQLDLDWEPDIRARDEYDPHDDQACSP